MGRIPIWVSRLAIQGGEAAETLTPRTTRATYRSQPARPFRGASSASCTPYPFVLAAACAMAAGSWKSPPVAWEYSRAMPRMLRQYPRSGVTVKTLDDVQRTLYPQD